MLFVSNDSKFDYIYEKYKRLLLSRAFDIVKDHALAEDAVSEAFIRAYRNLHKIGEADSPQTVSFLVTITKNVAINIYNKEKRMTPIDITEYDEADDFDMEELIEFKDETLNALQLVDSLREELKAVFLLKYAHDMNHKQIASVLGITENNVTVRLHRAKAKLIKMVKSGHSPNGELLGRASKEVAK